MISADTIRGKNPGKFRKFRGQEDVKKPIWLKFRLSRNVCRSPSSRLRYPGAVFFEAEIAPRSKSDFSHLPDGSGTLRMDPGGASGSRRVLC
jgi:hypothetical protein